MSSWECFILGCAADVAGSSLMCLSNGETDSPTFLPVMCGGGLVLVLVVPLAACLLWPLCFHVLILGYHVAVETPTALCLLLLWLPANQCLLWGIICGDVFRLVPLLWLLDVCTVAIDFRGKMKNKQAFPF